uniref:FAD-binding protein n=1 Tax=Okeania hirsuta TaxID=1458930 RepID=UPI001F02F27C
KPGAPHFLISEAVRGEGAPALTKPGAPHFLISEAVRGEGAHLIDDRGNRFAFEYHPAGELAPRDVVSRAIFHHLQKTADDPTQAHVYLDLRPIAPDRIRYRFPNIINVCKQWGIDVFQEPIPVAPAAHYWMGGIACNLMSKTSIRGLYAIGETASTGVHGANLNKHELGWDHLQFFASDEK